VGPIERPALAIWLNSLVRRYGPKVLRIRGLLIQHVIDQPMPLDAWPDDDQSSRIVFVVQDIDPRPIHESLVALLARRSRAACGDVGALTQSRPSI
jgi:hypothetical protein